MKLIKAKLSAPLLNFNEIYREDLINKIIESSDKGLILIVGSPGSGKTNIVYQFLKKTNNRYIWYTLDQKDNTIDIFWRYLSYALWEKGIIKKKFRDNTNIDHMSNILIDAVEGLNDNIFIVLDGMEVIETNSVLDSIQKVLTYIPHNLHIIIISQKMPEFNIPRLIVNKKVFMLTDKDLRLSNDDIKKIFRLNNIECSENRILKINEMSGGWLSGIVLLLEDSKNPDSSLNSNLEDYFNSQIIKKLQEDERCVLLYSSLFDLFTPMIISYISGVKNANKIFQKLNRYNILLERIGEETYKVNNLFRRYLSKKLKYLYGDIIIEEIYSRAGDYKSSNEPESAINFYLLAGNYHDASRIIKETVNTNYLESHKEMVKNWIYRFPEKDILKFPQVMHYKQIIARWEGDHYTFNKINRELKEKYSDTRYYFLALYEEANYSLDENNFDIAEKGAVEIINNIDKSDILYPASYNILGVIYMQKNMDKRAIEYYIKGEDIAARNNQMGLNYYIKTNRLIMEIDRGNYIYAKKELTDFLKGRKGFQTISPLLQFAKVEYTNENYSKGIEYSKRALKEARSCDFKSVIVKSYNSLYFGYLYSQSFKKAKKTIEKSIDIAKSMGNKRILIDTLMSSLWINLLLNNYTMANDTIEYINFQGGLDKIDCINCNIYKQFIDLGRGFLKPDEIELKTSYNTLLRSDDPVYFLYRFLLNIKESRNIYTIKEYINENEVNFRKSKRIVYNESIKIVELLIKYNELIKYGVKSRIGEMNRIKLLIMHNEKLQKYDNSEFKNLYFKSNKAQYLFYYFLFNKGKIIPREKIIDMFWQEKDFKEAGHLLRDYIYLIKKAFNNKNIIIYINKGYSLNTDIEWEVDYFIMKRYFREAENLKYNREMDDYLKKVEKGLKLCKYIPLQDCYYDWCFSYRNEIEDLFLSNSRERSIIYIEKGEFDKAESVLNNLIAKFPLEEFIYQELMVLYSKMGRKDRINKIYNTLTDMFFKELSLEPSEKSKNLYKSIIGK